MRLRTYGLLAAVSLLLAAPAAQSQTADTVRLDVASAISEALLVSPEVGAVRARWKFAQARHRFARANRFLTEFEVTTAHAPVPRLSNPNGTPTDELFLDPDVRNDFESYSLFSQVDAKFLQPVYTWGELGGSIAAAGFAADAEEAATTGKREEVALRAAELYYNVLLTEALDRLTKDASADVAKAKQEIERLLAEGAEDVDEADMFEVLITEQEFNRRVVEVRQKKQTARIALRRLLFIDDGAVVDLGGALLEPIAFSLDSLDHYQSIALAHRPEIRQAEAGLAARTSLVSVARSDYYPKFFVGGSAGIRYADGRFRQKSAYHSDRLRGSTLEAGVGLRQKLNFLQTRTKVEQAKAQTSEVANQLVAARQLVLFEVEDAYRNVIVAQAAMTSLQEALRLSKEWLRSEQINFDLDLGNTENLVRAVEANLTLQASAHEATHQYNLATLRLINATGTLEAASKNGTLVDF